MAWELTLATALGLESAGESGVEWGSVQLSAESEWASAPVWGS